MPFSRIGSDVRSRRVARWSQDSPGDQGSEEPVVDFRVKDCDPLPVGGEVVGVGAGPAFDQVVDAEPGEVVAGLVDGVGGAEQLRHLGAEALVGEAENTFTASTAQSGATQDTHR
jgi:hypothetical protein